MVSFRWSALRFRGPTIDLSSIFPTAGRWTILIGTVPACWRLTDEEVACQPASDRLDSELGRMEPGLLSQGGASWAACSLKQNGPNSRVRKNGAGQCVSGLPWPGDASGRLRGLPTATIIMSQIVR
jgi:hypothetical protein